MAENTVTVIGAGLAGVEAALQLARADIPVALVEMKPVKFSPAHKKEGFAELVCSNSFKAERTDSAAGLLKQEMRRFGSVCIAAADKCRVAAGGALAVDRDEFSHIITRTITEHPKISVKHEEVQSIPDGYCVIAAGPLASDALSESIREICGQGLSFFDAAAPIVTTQSIDMSYAFKQSRYDKGEGDDYINCPMNKEEYESFYAELINAECAELHEFDKRKDIYEGCMPIEVMALRGKDTIRFGPLKPVGLRDPRTGHRPWAVVQLRRENAAGDLLNLVGFQTNLKFSEQKRVFSMIPALKNAEFVRFGVMHRNTFINSPKMLNADFSMRSRDKLYFAGQITGVEGYMESASSGIIAGFNLARKIKGEPPLILPPTTMMGALSGYISDESVANFQPMGANFGILPPLSIHIKDKKTRYAELARRGLSDLERELSLL